MRSHILWLALCAVPLLDAQVSALLIEPGTLYPSLETVGPDQRIFAIRPKDGDFLRVWLRKNGFHPKIGLFRQTPTENQQLVVSSSASGPAGLEVISATVTPGETYLLTVEPFDWAERPVRGTWQLQVTVRTADAKDRDALAAQKFRLDAADLTTGRRFSEAAAALARAIDIYTRIEDRERAAVCWLTLGEVYLVAGDPAKSLDSLAHAQQLYKELEEPFMLGLVAHRTAFVLSTQGKAKEAADLLEQSAIPLLSRRSLNAQWDLAKTELLLASLREKLGQSDAAVPLYQSARKRYALAGDTNSSAKALIDLAEFQAGHGDPGHALTNALEALRTARASGTEKLKESALSTACWVHRELNQPRDAAPLCEEALVLATQLRDSLQATHLHNILSGLYSQTGEPRKAAEHKRLSGMKPQSPQDSEPQVPTSAGLLKALGELKQAEFDYLKRDTKAALSHAEKALLLLDTADGQNLRLRATVLSTVGTMYVGAGKLQEGMAILATALAHLRAAGLLAEEASAFGVMMKALTAKNPRAAIVAGKQAVALYQRIRGSVAILDANAQASYLQSVTSTYRSLADLLIAQGRLGEAEEVLSLLKQEEHKQLVRADTAGATITLTPDELEWQKKYEELTADFVGLGAKRAALQAKPTAQRSPAEVEELAGLVARMKPGNAAFSDFLGRMEKQFGAKDSRVAALNAGVSMRSTLAQLPAGTVAIYTLVGENGLRLVLVTPTAAKAYLSRITAADLNAKVAAYRQILKSPGENPLPSAQALYRILLPDDLRNDLRAANAQTLMWSLDGALRYLPVAALHDGQAWLAERYRLALFTGESQSLKDQPAPAWSLAGFGVSLAHDTFPALPAVKEELAAIGKALPGELKLDAEFTAAELLKQLSQNPRRPVVHIASHFAFRPGDGMASFLLLGDGSHLSISDLWNDGPVFEGVDLLTLSACDTASGGGGDGHEFEGLAMTAQKGGARAVLATLWSVSDASTGLLMREFYRLRQENAGLSKAEALQRAQLELIRGELTSAGTSTRGIGVAKSASAATATPSFPGYSHPFYWAPFVLIGNWK